MGVQQVFRRSLYYGGFVVGFVLMVGFILTGFSKITVIKKPIPESNFETVSSEFIKDPYLNILEIKNKINGERFLIVNEKSVTQIK